MQALVAFSITQALDGPTASYLGCTTDAPSCVSVCCGLRVCVLWPGEWRVAVCACAVWGPVCPEVWPFQFWVAQGKFHERPQGKSQEKSKGKPQGKFRGKC